MSLKAILKDIYTFPFFGGLEPSALEEVEDLFDSGNYEGGEQIIREGTRGNRLYVLVQGSATVTTKVGESEGRCGELLYLARLTRGDSFGEMELIDTQDRSATVTAEEATETVELTNMAFLELFRREPDVFRIMMMNLARDLSRRLRAADRRMALYMETGELPPPRGM